MKRIFAIFVMSAVVCMSVCACAQNEELTPMEIESEPETVVETIAAPAQINLDEIIETESVSETETEPETEETTTAAETKKETKAAKKETKAEKKETKSETKAETKAETSASTTDPQPAETDPSGYVTATEETENSPSALGQNETQATAPGQNETQASAPGSNSSSTSPAGDSGVLFVEKGPGQ